MKEKIIQSIVYEFESDQQIPEAEKKLLDLAELAVNNSYAPYSEFRVGAAALLSTGEVVTGSNQENASYPIGICAERVTLSAVSATHPGKKIIALAITFRGKKKLSEPVSPCGLCRQTLLEYEQRQESPIKIILRGEGGKVLMIKTVKDLLPLYFDGEAL
ncbi:MAG TPA: cytidine deaminase [Bacteroidetes bacterium]|mgnify:CR=1 FL=1|nr:cytidine deaminase [Bacteroidota bacterium]